MERLTVFTPTFNRRKTLERLYQSLLRQTVQSFVWIIVDDGSTDDTKFYVDCWVEECKLKIVYCFQENAGKMAAHNKGVSLCKTDLFVCIDSDDYLVDDAVELILENWQRIVNVASLCGIVAYRSNSLKEFPIEVDYSTLSGLYRRGFRGETTLVFKTDVLKKYLFPVIEGEKFITESYVYNQIDDEYRYFVLRKILTISEYQDDGYSKNLVKIQINNPRGYALFYKDSYGRSFSLKEKCRNAVWYIAFSILGKYKLSQIFYDSPNKFFCLFAFPLGIYKSLSLKREYHRIM